MPRKNDNVQQVHNFLDDLLLTQQNQTNIDAQSDSNKSLLFIFDDQLPFFSQQSMLLKLVALAILVGILALYVQWKDPDFQFDERVLKQNFAQFVANKTRSKAPTIAIIGAGISGASTAYFIKLLVPDANLVVYESSDKHIGGRLYKEYHHGAKFELGGTSIVKDNFYAMHLVRQFNLSLFHEDSVGVVIDNVQQQVRFVEHENLIMNLWRMVQRYGIDLFKIVLRIKQLLGMFKQTYVMQQELKTWTSAKDWLQELQLLDLSQQTMEQFFVKDGRISELFAREFLFPAFRVNYMQNSSANAFVGHVGLAMFASDFYTIPQGSQSFAEKMLESSGAKVEMNQQVSKVTKQANGRPYTVTTKNGATHEHDMVILAAPKEFSDIQLENVQEQPKRKEYVPMHVISSVIRNLNYSHPLLQGLKPNTDPYAPGAYGILFLDDAQFPNAAMLMKNTKIEKTHQVVYKMFSKNPLSDDEIRPLFEGFQESHRKAWTEKGAYTVLSPTKPETWSSFVLDQGLYYQNAFEHVVSTMETQIIASKNVALLLAKSLYK